MFARIPNKCIFLMISKYNDLLWNWFNILFSTDQGVHINGRGYLSGFRTIVQSWWVPALFFLREVTFLERYSLYHTGFNFCAKTSFLASFDIKFCAETWGGHFRHIFFVQIQIPEENAAARRDLTNYSYEI